MNGEPVATDIKFFSLTSRIGRARYLAYGMGLVLLAIVPILVCAALYTLVPALGGLVAAVLYIGYAVLSIGFGVRRLHDLDKSGWWILLMFVPLVNLGLLLYMLFAPGTIGENRFGQQPPPNSTWVIIGAWSFLIVPVFGGILAAIAIPAYQDFVARAQTVEAVQLLQGAETAAAQYHTDNKDWPADLSTVYSAAAESSNPGRYTQSISGSATADGGYAIVATMKTEGIMWAIRGKSLELWSSDGANWHCGPGGEDPVDAKYLIGSCRESGAP